MRESVRNKLIELGVLNIEEYIDGDTKNMKMRCEQCNTVTLHTFRALKKARQTSLCQSCIRFNNNIDELKSFGVLNIKDFKYRDTKNLKVICKTCGVTYITSLLLLRIAKHPQKCSSCVAKESSRISFPNELSDTGCLNPEEYINTHTSNLNFKCTECADTFTTNLANKLQRNKTTCNKCSLIRRSNSRKIDVSRFADMGCLNPEDYKDYYTSNMKFRCHNCKYGVFSSSIANYSRHSGSCSSCNKVSSDETAIVEFIREHTTESVETSNRTLIKPLELDIVLPTSKIAIEFNGLYWHSECNNRDKNYHISKTNSCRKSGYELIHILENEWIQKKAIIKSILLNKIGATPIKLHGRKTKIAIVTPLVARKFLNDNHRQGAVNSSINIGLYAGVELVSLMTFSKSRFGGADYELVRFCNRLNTTVVGGASKLLKYFRANYAGSIVTYADLRYSNGDLYKTLGFTFIHNSKPNYWYHTGNPHKPLESRLKFQKHKQQKILSNFDKNKTEYENMLDNGYNRIWDCGNAVYKLS